jgi:hypothetical protein
MSPQERQQIGDDDVLWRRLTNSYWIKDSNGTKRVSSAAFKGSPHDLELSTHSARLTTLEWVFNSRPHALGVGEIVARMARDLELVVEHDPVDDDASHTVRLKSLRDERNSKNDRRLRRWESRKKRFHRNGSLILSSTKHSIGTSTNLA